jgi:hypothetical protein
VRPKHHMQRQIAQQVGRRAHAGAHLGLWLAGRGGVEGQRHNKGEARSRVAHDVKLVLRRLHMCTQR